MLSVRMRRRRRLQGLSLWRVEVTGIRRPGGDVGWISGNYVVSTSPAPRSTAAVIFQSHRRTNGSGRHPGHLEFGSAASTGCAA